MLHHCAGEIQEMNELITRGLDYKPKSFGDLVIVFGWKCVNVCPGILRARLR
jgi:hypothetical protein